MLTDFYLNLKPKYLFYYFHTKLTVLESGDLKNALCMNFNFDNYFLNVQTETKQTTF